MRLATLPFFAVLAAALAGGGCASTRPYVSGTARASLAEAAAAVPTPAYEVFLVGDLGAGAPDDAGPVLAALRERLAGAGPQSAVVFLGDQLPAGLPDSGAAGRAEAEGRLRLMADAVGGFDGQVFVVPGDRDWRGGPDAVRRQERFVEGLLGRDGAFLPGGALAGPAVVELEDGPVLVALDTQWWLEAPDERPRGEVGEVEVETPGDVVQALRDVLAEHEGENVLVVGHHPVRSNGPRAGHYPLSTFLLPPVLGGALPLYRAFVGAPQDLASGRYRTFRLALETVLAAHDGAVYAAAHEHALEAYRVRGVTASHAFVVSGAAADADPVAAGGGALYAHGTRGFLVLRYGADGRVAVEAVEVEGQEVREATVAALSGPVAARVDAGVPVAVRPEDLPPRLGQTVTAAADSSFLAGPIKRFFLGRGYREAWAAPVEAPVLDLGRDYGGLTPTQRGGGLQSVSIRFRGGDGHSYQLRLLRKRSGEALPPELRTAVIEDIVRDQTSATNPYSALAASGLADAAGVLHAEPRLVYVPDDPRLGRYRELLAGRLAYIEIRPDDDMSDRAEFGRSEDVVSTPGLFEKMREDHDHRIDGRAFLRARLLDLMMSDWDRHVDQWRWAGFEPGQLDPALTGEDATRGKVYRPIPRDRDFAFYRIGGVFPGMAKLFQPKLQNYGSRYGSIRGLTISGIPLDRRLLSELAWPEWQAEVAALQAALTDEAVDAAFRRWPPDVYARYGAPAAADFRTRRAALPRAARRFYDLLARGPDVLGSDEREHFSVNRHADGATEVTVRHSSRDGTPGRTLFRRTFVPGETREVRLYALGGSDRLLVEGDGPARITVRFIGGDGDDVVEDRARSGRVLYYDDIRGNDADASGAIGLRLSGDPEVNRYDPFDYARYRTHSYYPSVGFNVNDGLLLGAGVTARRPRFRAAPAWHDLRAHVATATGGIDGRYALRDSDRWGRGHGLAVDIRGATQRNVRDFYGFGNDTPNVLANALYRVPVARVRAEAAYVRRIGDAIEVRVGPAVAYADVHNDSTGFATMPASGLGAADFEAQLHGGAAAELALGRVDDATNPHAGLRWTTGAAGWAGLNDAAEPYATVASELVFYASPSYAPQVTLAARVGGAHAFGDVPFFEAPTLGGSTLRGYRPERFTGRSALYQGAELRVKLFDLSTVVVPFEVGALAFADNGRVWADGEYDEGLFEGWHQGYGGGLWLGAVGRLVLTTAVGASAEGSLFYARLGFAY